jgi:hypothetical protein
MSLFTMEKLQTRIARAGVDDNLYSIGDFAEGCLCLVQVDDNEWETFFGERSEKSDLLTWESESDACFWFLGRLAWTEWKA